MSCFAPTLEHVTQLLYLDPGPMISAATSHALIWVIALLPEAMAVLAPDRLVRRYT